MTVLDFLHADLAAAQSESKNQGKREAAALTEHPAAG
jgi:hypothetical protein